MILILDVGNTQIYAGLFDQDQMKMSFRKNSKSGFSSDEIGVFLRSAIRENNFDPTQVTDIALCSVVPDVVYSIRGACLKYFKINPFILQPGSKTGLKIKYRNPIEVGADRIANSIGATAMYPGQNLIIIDMGTATTFDVVSKDKDYLGGAIMPGLRISMEALEGKTAKLPSVEIVESHQALGRSTVESIQSGLYYGHLGSMKIISDKLTMECFFGEKPTLIGTGGFAHLFEKEKVFDHIIPDLVLKGMLIALKQSKF